MNKIVCVLLCAIVCSKGAYAGVGLDLGLANSDLRFGVFSHANFEDPEKLDEEVLGNLALRADILISDEGNSRMLSGNVEVSRPIPLEKGGWFLGVGLRPALLTLKSGDTDLSALAIQLGGIARYRYPIGKASDFFVQARGYVSPNILTISDDLTNFSTIAGKAGFSIISDTAIYIEARSEVGAVSNSDSATLIDKVLLGISIGF